MRSSRAFAPRGQSCSARPTRRSSAPAARRSTRCSARRGIPTTSPRPAVARPAARRSRWPAACCLSPMARTWRRACATPAATATSSASGHARSRPRMARCECVEHAVGAGAGRAQRSDCALLLAAMAGPDLRAPTSIAEPGTKFLRPLARDFRKVRVAWSRDLGGLPMDPRVTAALVRQRRSFASLGCIVEEAEPDFSGATESFETLRALGFLQNHGALYRDHRDKLKDTVLWNIEQGLALTAEKMPGPRACAPSSSIGCAAFSSDTTSCSARSASFLRIQSGWSGRAKSPACRWRIISTG